MPLFHVIQDFSLTRKHSWKRTYFELYRSSCEFQTLPTWVSPLVLWPYPFCAFPNKKTDVRNSLALDIFILDECNPGSVYTPSHGGEGTGEPLADSVILRLREQLLWHPPHTRCFLSLAV